MSRQLLGLPLGQLPCYGFIPHEVNVVFTTVHSVSKRGSIHTHLSLPLKVLKREKADHIFFYRLYLK